MAALIFTIIVGLWSQLYAFLDERVDPRTTRNTKALELLEEFDRRVTLLKEAMVTNVTMAQKERI